MANPVKGEHAFEFGGCRYVAVLDINALCEAEQAADYMPIGRILKAAGAGSLAALRVLMWAALRRHEALNLEQAGELVVNMGAEAAFVELGSAIGLSFPKMEVGSTGEGPRPKSRGAGKTASRSSSKRAATRRPSGG